ncbi:uncharacterized protein MYCGRDRAFT_43729 [Zymoseptoria tritici IPO323]|uniref:3-isopropylmalate dehydrogenase n=1 Tax=Zymoseptoria tritici (strain CBS 115943 / IPO323) TaxID=336722 RepID=F9XEE7_ZYMTI|nr:uncharacterized protein MYCGRDRAFT_43729 [Zymoseptoria tritici IPO323]EGP86946.1 hypothetical protein MYCGRDRAFT_43729 [Zymoseptoria tritici IPO323]
MHHIKESTEGVLKPRTHRILVLEGDYSGPEVMAEGLKILTVVQEYCSNTVHFELEHELIGGASFDAVGENVSAQVLTQAAEASAVLLGAVGGPKWMDHPVPVEMGLGRLRRSMQAFANVRPIRLTSPVLAECSSLKTDVCTGTDVVVVRELTGGMYFGRKEEAFDNNGLRASDVDEYTRAEIERVVRMAGTMASTHSPALQVTSVDKANALACCGRFWRSVASDVLAREFPAVPVQHMLVDSAAMVLAMTPRRLNGVVVTSNMFGDILSDVASAVPGSIGLLPSASLCDIPRGDHTPVRGLYEPIHGSAPDLAGKGIVNPLGMILSVAMMCRYSLALPRVADDIETAVGSVLDRRILTADLGGTTSTSRMGDAVAAALREVWSTT